MKYPIRYNSTPPSKIFEVNNDEDIFFNALYSKLTEKQNLKIRLARMSNGTLSVDYGTYPIGKVKLQGRKHWIQILTGLYNSKSIEGKVEDFLPNIDSWIKYMKRL